VPAMISNRQRLGPAVPRAPARVLLCIAAYLFAPAGLGDNKQPGPGVGDVAPDFTTKAFLSRQPVTLSEQHGKLVFLTFWASWCPPCRKEMPVLEQVQRKLGKERATVLAVSFRENNEQQVRKWARDGDLQLTLLEDWNGHIARQYGVHTIPHLYIIDRQGRIVHVHTGYGPNSIEHLVRDINAALRDSGEGAVAEPPPADAAPSSPEAQSSPDR
jgi:peroxiredoxin